MANFEALLDNVTNGSSTPTETVKTPNIRIDPSTGEILRSYDPLVKWELQATAKHILTRAKQSHRIFKCW